MATEFRVRRFGSRRELEEALAERLRTEIEAPAERVALMLSGGNTPLPAFRALGAQELSPAPGLSIFYSDERYVPITSDASNFHQSTPLLNALPGARVLRVRTELPLEHAAEDYEQQLAALLRSAPALRFGMLGLGADGHTASLFSIANLERSIGRLAIAVHRPDGRDAITVTPQVLSRFESLLFTIAGADKRAALQGMLAHDANVVAWRAISARAVVDVWADSTALGS
jgi:6-phosphogluconolactonase